MAAQLKGGGTRKYGRNKMACANYRSMQQRERNKGRRLQRHLRRFPDDHEAQTALKKLPAAFQK